MMCKWLSIYGIVSSPYNPSLDCMDEGKSLMYIYVYYLLTVIDVRLSFLKYIRLWPPPDITLFSRMHD